MLAELKFAGPPLLAVGVVIANAVESAPHYLRLVLDVAALAVLLAGFLVLGRLRAQASAAEGAASAWREERDAAVVKNDRLLEEEKRLRAEISDLRVQVTQLEARPTLESLQAEIQKLGALMAQTASAVSEALGTPPKGDTEP